MRILNIMLAKGRGGVESMSLHYHNALILEGFEVLSLGHPDGVLASALAKNTAFKPLNARVNHDPFALFDLYKILKSFKPDLILTHGNRATGLALSAMLGYAGRTIQVVHNFRHKDQIKGALAAICVSASVRESVAQSHPRLSVFEVVNFSDLRVSPVKVAPNTTPVIGALGRLHVNKGFDVLLHSALRLRDQEIDFKLKIAGLGPQKPRLEHLSQKLGLSEIVEFCGWVDPAEFLCGLDLFVLPSRVEPFGLVATEAMAAGVPIIASNIEGPSEILQAGKLGQMCAPNDEKSLAEAIKTTLNDWDQTLMRAKIAQTHAIETYGLKAGQTRLKAIITQIAQKTTNTA